MKKYLNVKNIARIGILGALAGVLMIFDFPIAIAPSFYKLDISDLPCLIGAFAMGPIPGVFIELVKILVKLLLKPTSTAFVGETAAIIISTSFCVSASLVYRKNKSKKQAIKAMVVGSIVMAVVGTVSNYLFIIPAYCNLYNMPLEVIVGAGTAIFPIVNDKLSFVLCCVAPFNIIKAVIVDILTMFLYKHISPLLRNY